MTTRYLLKCLLLLSALFCQQALFGQTGSPGTISTYAGNDALFAGGGQPATAAQVVEPNNIAFDGKGNVYVSASGLSMVLKVAANGVISVVAGNGLSSGGGDGGLATGASLAYPAGLAFDSSGNLYIADSYNSNVRKVDTNGIISTVAGDGGASGFAGDGGPATKALLQNPAGIAVDKSGNLYIADRLNQRIRMVAASTGIITTIAGSSTTGWHGDGGPAVQATFTLPSSIAIDSAGNLYIADQNNWSVRRISTSGIITTVAGTGQWGSTGDGGQATKATMAGPQGVAVDAAGNLYIADSGNQRIRRVDPSGIITTIAGTGTGGFSGDGTAATGATFSNPVAVAVDASGAVYVADGDNNRIRRFTVGGAVTTFAGTTTSVGDGGPSTQARVEPWSIAVDSAGNLYIADRLENRVRKVTPSGTISTVAGTGQTGYSGDNGPGVSAALSTPNSVAVDSAGNVYIADAGNNRIRRVDASTGKITTFAGASSGSGSYTGTGTGGDGGMATSATLNYPTSVAVDGAGNVYFVQWVQSDTSPQAIAVRRVTTDGKINTWAGGGTTATGYGGDDGSPLKAVFGSNVNIAAGPDGSLYIVDTNNNRVRKVDPTGTTITTVAGNGQNTASGNGGAATSAGVPYPWSVVVDAAGNLYIGNIPSVRKVSPGGIIGPYAGNGQYSFSGDGGPATSAAMTGASRPGAGFGRQPVYGGQRQSARSNGAAWGCPCDRLVVHHRDLQAGNHRFHGHHADVDRGEHR
jgi:sugar lactone lactonase YvrE